MSHFLLSKAGICCCLCNFKFSCHNGLAMVPCYCFGYGLTPPSCRVCTIARALSFQSSVTAGHHHCRGWEGFLCRRSKGSSTGQRPRLSFQARSRNTAEITMSECRTLETYFYLFSPPVSQPSPILCVHKRKRAMINRQKKSVPHYRHQSFPFAKFSINRTYQTWQRCRFGAALRCWSPYSYEENVTWALGLSMT